MSAGDLFKVYCLFVPQGTSTLTVTLTQLYADYDLYVGYGTYSSIEGENYDWSSQESGTDSEMVSINSPQPGYYYIQVVNYEQLGSSYRLLASTT